MSRVRRMGLTFVFAATLAGGVLTSTPANAYTLNATQCSRFAGAVQYLTHLAATYPNSKLVAYLLEEVQEAYDRYCS